MFVMRVLKHLLFCTTLCIPFFNTFAATVKLAPIAGFARSFLTGSPIASGTVTILETGQQVSTNSQGHFGPILYPVGKPVTLEFAKWGYETTQTATVIVPEKGLVGPYDNLTFQVPSVEAYYLLAKIIGATIDPNSCHVTTTITAFHKTMDDIPQGEANAALTLSPTVKANPFYFGIYESGLLKGKTNPFAHGLTSTSEDGGAAFFNLPPSDKPYIISASKQGVTFTRASFICKKGSFINISPPRGPMAYG